MNDQTTSPVINSSNDEADEFQLAVGDIVEVPVKFTMKKGSVHKLFSFTVLAERLDQDAIDERMAETGKKATDFMRDLMRGWRGQALVLRSDNTPADYSDKARDAMLNAAGVGVVIFNSYLKECGATVKN